MEDIDLIVDSDEAILWQGRPALLPFFAGALLSLLFGVGLFAIASHFAVGQPGGRQSDSVDAFIFLTPILLAGFLLAVAYPVWRLLEYLRLSYAITNQRVVLQDGVIEHDVAMVDFDQIVDASVDINLADIFLGLG